ncbi:hypothetical protein F5Y04DRAFT_288008 [Hypomontagnella monticulosa]|nr:hypothetical protein F5Y04DRAFT_288008 [Hypomontagnella monticulosa]
MASAAAKSDRLVKFTIFFKKRDDISYDKFHKYWSETHARIFLSLPIVRQKLVKYYQYHSDKSVDVSKLKGFTNVLGYDGVGVFCTRTFEDLEAIFTDEEFIRIAVPDGAEIFDLDAAVVMIGWDEEKWENGKAL